jgi:lipopolysaccharide export system ATP-binding protein
MSRTNFDDTAPGGLSVVGLSKAFKRRKVLTDVSMHLNRGEVVALLGPNGAGKTTSFYSIAGMISVDTGSVSIDGRDVTNLPMYRRARLGLGYLPQEASIFRGMTVEQNIASVIELWEPTRANQRRRTEQLMEEFSIAQLRNSPAMALSGGERRRVEIARCLAGNPNYVLLDEPFAGVDPIAVGDIRTLVAQLKSRDIGVLITDHNVRETLEIIDRAYILYGGEVLMSGSPEEVVKNKDVRRVYLGNEFQV